MLQARLASAAVAVSSAALATVATIRSWGTTGRRTAALWAVRFVHFASTLGILTFPLLLDSSWDMPYLVAASAVIASWYVFKNECILSAVEKRILDPGYVYGSSPYRHVYLELVVGSDRRRQLPIFVGMVVAYTFVALRFTRRYWCIAWPLVAAAAVVNIRNILQ